ncbi:trithorax group protein osa-like isoform X2 [Dromiciops gliroides]|uniref:trithorax group protein osa-like isoform X2 n=1 Tax=Dromiciops gliroides TaxID=33562 RepID=UPI001CC7D06B|nr:trithorax group protein osa-like isoform X2 [Dromiciops gliroides]
MLRPGGWCLHTQGLGELRIAARRTCPHGPSRVFCPPLGCKLWGRNEPRQASCVTAWGTSKAAQAKGGWGSRAATPATDSSCPCVESALWLTRLERPSCPADWPDQAKDVPLGDPGPSCFQDEYVWRLSQLLGSVPPSQEELSPCGSESICTEDFEAYFQEAMVEATPPSGARTGSPESLGGHISRVSQGPPPQPLSSRKHQQPPEEKGAPSQESSQALPEDPSPRLGPAALGTARGRSLLQLGGSFPEKWRPKRDPGVGPARRQHGDPGEPSPHTESRNAQQPLTPSPHDRRVHWDCELPPDLLPNDPARRQLSRPLAVPFSSGPQDPRLCLAQARGNLSASLWEPGSLLPSCLLGYRAPGSQKEEPRLSHRKGLKKEQETPGDPKPWKWSKKLESMKEPWIGAAAPGGPDRSCPPPPLGCGSGS